MLVVEHGDGEEGPAWPGKRIFDDDGGVGDAPGVLVEPAADHLPELGPGEERRDRGVRGHESLPVVPDEGEQVRALLGVRSISRTPKKKIASK